MLLPVFVGSGANDWADAVAFADDVQGDTLAHLTLRVSIGQNGHVTVGMKVDESGTYHQPAGFDHVIRVGGGDTADAGNLPMSNPDVRV